jgi:hypothetical protein
MTALPDWMDLPDGMSVAEYEALPEEICRRIEIVDGAIIVNAAPRRLHQDICRRVKPVTLGNVAAAVHLNLFELSTSHQISLHVRSPGPGSAAHRPRRPAGSRRLPGR